MKMGACMHNMCVIYKYDIKTQHAVEAETHICAHTTCCRNDTNERARCTTAGCRLRCRWASAPCASCLPQPRQTTPPETLATGSGKTLQGEKAVGMLECAQAASGLPTNEWWAQHSSAWHNTAHAGARKESKGGVCACSWASSGRSACCRAPPSTAWSKKCASLTAVVERFRVTFLVHAVGLRFLQERAAM
jgi:hypothetical protein